MNIDESQKADELAASADELCEFVSELNMGAFYGKKIKALTKRPSPMYVIRIGGYDPEYEARIRRHNQEYRDQLRKVRDRVYTLAVELLRYQKGWNTDSEDK